MGRGLVGWKTALLATTRSRQEEQIQETAAVDDEAWQKCPHTAALGDGEDESYKIGEAGSREVDEKITLTTRVVENSRGNNGSTPVAIPKTGNPGLARLPNNPISSSTQTLINQLLQVPKWIGPYRSTALMERNTGIALLEPDNSPERLVNLRKLKLHRYSVIRGDIIEVDGSDEELTDENSYIDEQLVRKVNDVFGNPDESVYDNSKKNVVDVPDAASPDEVRDPCVRTELINTGPANGKNTQQQKVHHEVRDISLRPGLRPRVQTMHRSDYDYD